MFCIRSNNGTLEKKRMNRNIAAKIKLGAMKQTDLVDKYIKKKIIIRPENAIDCIITSQLSISSQARIDVTKNNMESLLLLSQFTIL